MRAIKPLPDDHTSPAGAKSATVPSGLFRFVPALDSLRHYNLRTFSADSIAGLTVAAVAVPQAMAYAQIAGLPPQYGLYTAIVMTAVGALFDSSKQLINGPTNAISIAVLSALVAFTGDVDRVQAAILLAGMVGAIQLAIALFRLGDLSRFISHAVIVGFTFGAAVLLVLDQFKNLAGLPTVGTGDDHFLKRFWLSALHAGQLLGDTTASRASQAALLVGLITMAVALGLRGLNRWLRIRLPDLLVAVMVSAAIVWWWKLDTVGVKVVGTIPASLPTFALPAFEWHRARTLFSGSVAIALLGILEAVSMAKAIASQTRQKIDVNQQCVSEALANIAGSMFHCYPGSGSLTRSTINQQAGAQTQWSGVIAAVAVALTMVAFAPYAFYIPKAGLAGILMISAGRLVNWRELKYYLRTTRFDAWIVALTAISAVVVSVEFCVLIGVFLSFLFYVPRAARVFLTQLTLTPERTVRERVASDPPCGRIRIYSLEGELFFGASPELEQHLDLISEDVAGGMRVLVLRMKRVRNPDAVCLEILDRFVARMRDAQVCVVLCGVRNDLMKGLRDSGLVERIGPDHVFVFQETGAVWSSTLEALRFAYEYLGDDVCDTCPRHGTSLNEKEGWSYMI
ncbi:MAG: SulP family inorganic anion transporter [Planctomycetia bacterium]|nr:SulP family inorganic anion transporter [Planctomycetia bacterium]